MEASIPSAAVEDFPFVHRERVRFGDCDPMGHVNNAAYSTYLEQARIGVLQNLGHFILARVEIDFRSELRPGDEIEIRSRCSRIGTKSFDLEHEIHCDGRVAAQGKSVLVGYDYERGESILLSDDWKRRLAA
jgi:acyl-CoA thioester hydrolase